MEVFVDFGAFELMAASGVMGLSRIIYRRPISRWTAMALSVAAPAVLLIQATSEGTRWIACLALATSLINVAVIGRLLRDGVLYAPDARPPNQAAAAVRTM